MSVTDRIIVGRAQTLPNVRPRRYRQAMTTELPNNIKNILQFLASAASGYTSGLKWNEEDRYKSDLNRNRRYWERISPKAVHDYCIALGMQLEDARNIAEWLRESHQGKRFRPSSSNDFMFDHESLAKQEPADLPEPQPSTLKAITVNANRHPEEAQNSALRWAQEQRTQHGGTILIYAPGVQNITGNTTPIPRLIQAKKLQLATKRRGNYHGHNGPIIALWPTKEMLESLEGIESPVCVVPWIDSNVEAWVQANHPTVLGDTWRAPTNERW